MKVSLKAVDTFAVKDSLVVDSLAETTEELLPEPEPEDLSIPELAAQEEKDYKNVLKIYEKMKPAEAAKILAQLDPNVASQISQLIMKQKK